MHSGNHSFPPRTMSSSYQWMTPMVMQIWTVATVLLGMIGQGMALGFTACLLPALQAPDSPIEINLETSSWLSASLGMACLLSLFYSPFLMNFYGRRVAYIVHSIPALLGLLFIYFASDVTDLIIGRLLCGLTSGSTAVLGAVVIGEYTSPEYRGVFLNLKTAFLFLGSTIVHALGYYFNWRTVAIINLVPFFVSFVMLFIWPESPAWLASKKKFEKSRKSFYQLRGKTNKSTTELEELIKSQKEVIKRAETTIYGRLLILLKIITNRDFVKPVIIVIFAAILLETSGRHIFPAYATQIIADIIGSDTKSFYYTLSVDLIISGSAIFSAVLMKIMRRRTLLFSTGIASLIVLISLCTYLFMSSNGIISKDRPSIPVTFLAVYLFLVNLGCGPMPFALIGELFPLAHRAIGSNLAGIIIASCLFLVLKTTPLLIVTIKVYGTFAVLAILMSICLLFLYFALPETKDRTLQEIENYFHTNDFEMTMIGDDDPEANKSIINNDSTSK